MDRLYRCRKWRYATSRERKARARATTSNGMFEAESCCDIGGMEVSSNVVLLLAIAVIADMLSDVGAIARVWRSARMSTVREKEEARLLKQGESTT
jgi:hypothetical protein